MKGKGIFAASAALAASMAVTMPAAVARIFGYENIRRHLQRQKRDHGASTNSIAKVNRWTGQPHEHRREIARRARQAARRRAP